MKSKAVACIRSHLEKKLPGIQVVSP